ncbi:MAG: ribosome silencing factor [Candidatus Wallbacteria bacterium]|nr:ribosome silencing factor [Candidatus Wallbacteria bacterium]
MEKALQIREWLLDKKGLDIVIMVPEHDILVDKFMIVTAGSVNQIAALAEHLKEKCRGQYFRMDGEPESEWVVADLSNILVHIFSERMRRIYNLEELGKEIE